MKDLDICAERARLTMTGAMPKVENDAASVGTAVHTGIELAINAWLDDGVPLALSAAREAAHTHFAELVALDNFRWVKFKPETARTFIDGALAVWHDRVAPTLRPMATEVSFGPLALHEDEHRIIEVTGSIDYLDERWGPVDWKTASRDFQEWEYDRWGLQPTVYCWALTELGYENAGSFEFVVFVRKNNTEVNLQRFSVRRHEGDFAWLRERALGIAHLIEADVPSWPRNDNTALCSPKWCPAWDACKGAYYSATWPKPSEPAVATSSDTG